MRIFPDLTVGFGRAGGFGSRLAPFSGKGLATVKVPTDRRHRGGKGQ